MRDRLNKWRYGLDKTRQSVFGRITNLLKSREIYNSTWDELEALLIQADMGVDTALEIIEKLKMESNRSGWTAASDIKAALRDALSSKLITPSLFKLNSDGLTVILIVGVNGSGKTTSIAKLGKYFKGKGHQVVLAAADTYRAAAVNQLQIWGERLEMRVVIGQEGGDPGAVVFDSIKSAQARGDDILLVDTAGRLHTRYNLMEEIKKIYQVAGKALPGAPHGVWLVLDATTGQNAIIQAQAFRDAVGVTGIILAKLDTSARGGMIFAIQKKLGLPILFVGLGEDEEDLEIFDPDLFIDGLVADFDN